LVKETGEKRKMLTSVNVSPIAFQASIDSTRLNMACRQISQSLSDLNTNIPYIISNEYRKITDTSSLGIYKAKGDGKVIYNNDGVFIIYYRDLDKIEIRHIPLTMKTTGNFASPLRYSVDQYKDFNKNDILYEYSEFTRGIPSYGYNVFTGFLPFFGFNHEDSLVISESLAEKTNANFVDKVYVPITEYTIFQQFYPESVNETGGFFPNIGDKIKDNIVCCGLEPKTSSSLHISNPKNVKQKMLQVLKTLNISDLVNMNTQSINNFILNKHSTKIEDGRISEIRIHRLRTHREEINMIDSTLQNILEHLYTKYSGYIKNRYNELLPIIGKDTAIDILKKYYIYADDDKVRHKINLKSAVYLLEFEITSRESTKLGDKLANTCANKGVVSEILPNDLRPIAITSQQPIDLVFNPFGVFSRMNLGQLSEGTVGKNVMYCDKYIKSNPEKTIETITWLNEKIIKHLRDEIYYNDVKKLIQNIKVNKSKLDEFTNAVRSSNLFIEAPQFAETNIHDILENGVNPNEKVLLKKETIKYFKQKLNINIPFPSEDCEMSNIFCCPLYIMKLYKLTKHICNARDFGPVRQVTKQPLKGRAKSGGSRIGQMEIEAILAHGCERSIKEFMTVKSDWSDGKRDLLRQLIESGKYILPEDNKISSQTKKVVDVQIEFLKS
jgi:DNA-directed RNA polymerase beta subunit